MSESVNSFTLSGFPMWISRDERSSLRGTIESLRETGETSIRVPVPGGSHDFGLDELKTMLNCLEKYAWYSAGVTTAHKDAVKAMTEIAEVDAYDHAAGYPERLTFEI